MWSGVFNLPGEHCAPYPWVMTEVVLLLHPLTPSILWGELCQAS